VRPISAPPSSHESVRPRAGTSDPTPEAPRDLLQKVGSGTRINEVNDEYKAVYRALSAVLHRLGIAHTNPYRDLWRFFRIWEEKQLGSYASRRAYASELYDPVRLELEKLEWATLVAPVAGGLPTGRDRRSRS
jgi:hypothetical protein